MFNEHILNVTLSLIQELVYDEHTMCMLKTLVVSLGHSVHNHNMGRWYAL